MFTAYTNARANRSNMTSNHRRRLFHEHTQDGRYIGGNRRISRERHRASGPVRSRHLHEQSHLGPGRREIAGRTAPYPARFPLWRAARSGARERRSLADRPRRHPSRRDRSARPERRDDRRERHRRRGDANRRDRRRSACRAHRPAGADQLRCVRGISAARVQDGAGRREGRSRGARRAVANARGTRRVPRDGRENQVAR